MARRHRPSLARVDGEGELMPIDRATTSTVRNPERYTLIKAF